MWIALLGAFESTAQNPNAPLSNLRQMDVVAAQNPIVADSLTIVWNSVQIVDYQNLLPIDSSFFAVKNHQIWLTAKGWPALANRRLRVSYRVLPFNLGRRFVRLDSTRLDPLAPERPIEFDYSNPSADAPLFEKGLDYSGNYTQGFSVGNAQNLVVNQNFNLNLAGKLGDLDIVASMTDNNLPIQAEGNTLQLREFDRIFIQLKKGKNALLAGDYELMRPSNTYFLNYFKKLQGVTFNNDASFLLKKSLSTTQTATLSTKASLAIVRGKFARNVLPVQEGNQGPYRLFGTEGGNFFIVLAGTEKVFFDGKLLTRGEENDYVIDYNRGDIIFTPKRLVTKDSRIIVEFEYADQSYLRSTMALSNAFKVNKWRVNFNFYSEQDAKNSSGTQALDSLDKAILRLAGNNPDLTSPLSIRAVDDGFRADRVQYKLVDTLVGGRAYRGILVFSTNPDSAKYTATFTPVGDRKGNYVQVATANNGRVYQWVAPDANGAPNGNFEPIKRLTPPNQQQLMTLGTSFEPFRNTQLTVEGAMSRYDANRFSALGDSANAGFAVFAGLKNQLNLDQKKTWKVETDVKFEALTTRFRFLNPYRPAEFTRDWNLPNANGGNLQSTIGNLNARQTPAAENLLLANVQIVKTNWFAANYELGTFVRDSVYRGVKHFARFNLNRKDYALSVSVNELNTEGVSERSAFSRPMLDLSKRFKKNWRAGAHLEREKNGRRDLNSDTLNLTSFYYDLWRVFVERQSEKGGNVSVNYGQRLDYQPFRSDFKKLSTIDELGVTGNFSQKAQSNLIWNVTYRNLNVADTSRTTLRSQETYLGRLEYNFSAAKNAIVGNTLYEIGSGQEQRIEYQYVRVNKGEGQYVWRDRNNDGTTQLDEFEVAPFADQADYVRVSLFTNQFIRTNNVSFAQSLKIDPRSLWYQKTGVLKFFSRFSTNSNVLIARRVKNDDPSVSQWNPFELAVPDRSLIALTLNMRNSLFFNRSNPKWDAELGQLSNRNRVVVVTGYEERARAEIYLRNRWNVSRNLTVQHYTAQGNQRNQSEAFFNRNYNLRFVKFEPQVNWNVTSNVRFILAYKFRNGYNSLKTNGETVRNDDFSLEGTWNQGVASQIRAKFNFVKIAYAGERNTPIEFALLEGLQNGRNFIWNLNLDRSLSKNIILSLNYEGRKIGDVRTVHVGRAQVRANF